MGTVRDIFFLLDNFFVERILDHPLLETLWVSAGNAALVSSSEENLHEL